jgi:uncharacterized membrane protein
MSSTFAVCSIDGGCGHLHAPTTTLADRRSATSTRTCTAPGCGRPRAGEWLCSDCREGLGTDLLAVRSAWSDPIVTRTRQDRITEGGGSGETPLPWNEAAARATPALLAAVRELDALLGPVLVCPAGDCRCQPRDRAVGRSLDPVPLARWLWRHRSELLVREPIGPYAARLDNALRAARAACDLPQFDRQFYVGPCPRPGESGPCPGELWALLPVREVEPAKLACSGCNYTWPTTSWLRASREIQRRMRELGASPGQGVDLLDQAAERRLIDRTTLRRLTARAQSVITKHCEPVAMDVRSREPLYDADVCQLTLAAVPTRNRAGQRSA